MQSTLSVASVGILFLRPFEFRSLIVQQPVAGKMGTLSVPHVQNLTRPLKPGVAVFVKGTATGVKFDINLTTGPNVTYGPGGDDISLHVSFRGNKNVFVVNSFAQGAWNGEEVLSSGGVQKGSKFEIVIGAAADHFKVYGNNNYVGDVRYRSPTDAITHVQVQGDVSLEAVEQIGGEAQPEPVPQPEAEPEPTPAPQPEPNPIPGPEPTPTPTPTQTTNLSPTPYVLPIPSHFGPGHKLRITAVPNTNAARFHVNLYAGFLNAFHYESRFSDQTVSRDSRKEGEDWDRQIETDNKLQGFPYAPGKQFELVYVSENDAFQVFVDGAHHFSFRHRLPPNEIDAVGIEGDIKLANVAFE